MIKIPNIKGLAKAGKLVVAAHRPEILFGTSIVTTVSAVVAAAVGGYKSGQQVLKAEHPSYDWDEGTDVKLDVKEKIQLTWLNYLPAAGLTAGALGSTTGLHIVHVKEKKAIAAAALMAVEEVREQAQDYINDIAKAVDDKVEDPDLKKEINKATAENYHARMVDADQLYLVKDEYTGRTFYSTENKIQNALNEVNGLLNTRDVELNSFYVWAGVPEIQDGDEFGWNNRDFVTVAWEDAHLEDGRPVRAFTFRPRPKKGYEASGN